MGQNLNKQTIFNFVILCPLFIVYSLLFSRTYNARSQDFAAYWQAGHMVLLGQDVYDSQQWIAVRQSEGTALHSEPTFQYPLPMAILFSPLALLSVDSAYLLWMIFVQILLLTSIVILLSFYPKRSGYLELLAIAGIFLFRPTFSLIYSGQISTLLLFLLSLSIFLFHRERWFLAGFTLSVFSLKPSIGLPVLALTGLWLLSRKQWRGIWGMIIGGLLLAVIGVLVNPRWIFDYINISGDAFSKYYGLHPTLWGVADKIFKIDSLSLTIGFVCVIAVFALETYLFWRSNSNNEAFDAFASIIPSALLIAPYSWNYDQILLTVPIIFLLIHISMRHGIGKTALFMFGIVVLAVAMVIIAYSIGHDVMSFLNTLLIWIAAIYVVIKNYQFQNG